MVLAILSGIAAFLCLLLAAYLLRRSKSSKDLVFAAALVVLAGVEVADRLSLIPEFNDFDLRKVSQVLEALAALLFIVFSHIHARNTNIGSLFRIKLVLFALIGAIPFIILLIAGNNLFYSPDLVSEEILFLGSAGYVFYLVLMGMYILSIVQVERTFTATSGSDRYRIKLEIIGIMSLYAVMVLYYSHSILYRTINMNLLPVRSGIIIAAVVLVGFSRIVRGSGVHVSPSRHVYYRSVALLIVGVYLLVLGIAGDGMKYAGFDGGNVLITFIAFVGGIIILIAILSEKLRRAVKVLVSKHFFATKYDYREAWLKFTDRLASCSSIEEVGSTIGNTYREFFGLQYEILYIGAGSRNHFEEMVPEGGGKQVSAVQISDGLSRYFLQANRVWNPNDSEYIPTAEEKTFVEHLDAFLVVPLINIDRIEGLVVFGKQLIFEPLIYEDYDLMKSLGRQAAQAIANFRLSEEITEMRAIAAVAKISSFVVHDLKNLASSLALVVDNARQHIGEPEFQQDAIRTISGTLEKMKQLTHRLRSIPEKITISAQVENIDRLAREIVAEYAKMRTKMAIEYIGSPAFAVVDAEEIRKVLVNLVQNAIEACGEEGSLRVMTCRKNGSVCIRVSDNGSGMTGEFLRNSLFKPFQTTKKSGLGLGLYQCRQIVEAHCGHIEVSSVPDKGTEFTVYLPAAEDAKIDLIGE